MPNRSTQALLALFSVASLSACSSLPTETEPQVLRSFAPIEQAQQALGPQPDRDPDLLLRDFYTASAQPSEDYAVARSYLVPETAQRWRPGAEKLIIDRIDINTRQLEEGESSRSFDVSGTVIATLSADGSYRPESGSYEATITMTRSEDGQWRISSLPVDVVIERSELRDNYEPRQLYFFDPTGRDLVADRRWIFSGQGALATTLIHDLMAGPSRQLAPGVQNLVPAGADFLGIEDGTYRFSGFQELPSEQRIQFAAQLVWTLTDAEIPGPYAIEVDGRRISENYEQFTSDDFAAFNPNLEASTVSPLYALADGTVVRVSGTEAIPLPGLLGTADDVESLAIAQSDEVAAVRRRGEGSQLWLGTLDADPQRVMSGQTLSRPSFDAGARSTWVVVDGTRVVRVLNATGSQAYAPAEVDISELQDLLGEEGTISVLQLSSTGVRVAMIINGNVYEGIVDQSDPNRYRITNVVQLADQLSGTAVSLDWYPDGALAVGTSSSDAPVWRVEQDGAQLTALPSGNITAPVVAIAAGANTLYLTDALAIRQLSTGQASDSSFWREIPGLQGVRSSPIVVK